MVRKSLFSHRLKGRRGVLHLSSQYMIVQFYEVKFNIEAQNQKLYLIYLNPTYYGPFGATPDIEGGHNVPPISYACSTCAILMKLSEVKQLDK